MRHLNAFKYHEPVLYDPANFYRKLLMSSVSFIFCVGIAALYSAGGGFEPWATRQLLVLVMFAPAALLIAHIPISYIYRSSYFIYGFCVLLLVVASVFGHKAMGAQRWIKVGSWSVQPSEFMKIGLIMALSRYMHSLHSAQITRMGSLLIPLLLIALPTAIVLKQPNLGTAIILITISCVILFLSGIQTWKFLTACAVAVTIAPVIWTFMHAYQKQRVLTFLNPQADPLGAGYNVIQSMIAIGSGGVLGKGFIEGSQSQLSFLPEKQTDFILSLIGEELGFIGVFSIIVFTATASFACYMIASHAQNSFFRLICAGVSALLAAHAIINSAMIAGLLPVVGVPYPLLSYGGSSLVAFMVSFGVVLNPKSAQKMELY